MNGKESKLKEYDEGVSFLTIALIYVGTIVGAGFASGREIWQFFGVFGNKGKFGIVIVGTLFIVISLMTTLITRFLRTNDIGRVVFPSDSSKLWDVTGYFMAVMLFTVLVFTSSAGGALLYQQMGVPRFIGSAIVIILTCVTVFGGLKRIGQIFNWIIPILLVVMVIVCTMVIFKDLPLGNVQQEPVPSPMAPNVFGAALLYASYNIIGIISIIATTAVSRTRNTKTALKGAALGSVFMAILAWLVYKALMTDPGYCQAMDMPILGFAAKLGPFENLIYTVVLMVAIYATSSTNFYGFTTKLKNDNKKKFKIVFTSIIAYIFSLIGFKSLIAYFLPIQGLCGAVMVVLIIINFFRVIVANYFTTQEKDKYTFPEEIINVTTGFGSESLLIIGSEKTALMDCSMAYCGEALVGKIKKRLGGRPLDYIFISHTHYDHIGAIPYLKKEWPNVVCIGAEHGKQVLDRPGALKVIKKLGNRAAEMYSHGTVKDVSVEGLTIDKVVHDGDIIDLGDEKIVVLETPGHTRCSLTFVLEPAGIMMAAESVGILNRRGICHPAVLQSFEDSINSIQKCREYNPKRIIISHYGIIPANYNKKVWDVMENEIKIERHVIQEAWKNGMTEEEIFEMMTEKYWYDARAYEQPFDAFKINMLCTIRLYKVDE